MAIQTVGNQNSWAQFMRAAQSARQRNRGLGSNPAALARNQKSVDRAQSPARRACAPQNAALAQKLYAPRPQAQQQKVVVGARFDAYA